MDNQDTKKYILLLPKKLSDSFLINEVVYGWSKNQADFPNSNIEYALDKHTKLYGR